MEQMDVVRGYLMQGGGVGEVNNRMDGWKVFVDGNRWKWHSQWSVPEFTHQATQRVNKNLQRTMGQIGVMQSTTQELKKHRQQNNTFLLCDW